MLYWLFSIRAKSYGFFCFRDQAMSIRYLFFVVVANLKIVRSTSSFGGNSLLVRSTSMTQCNRGGFTHVLD